MCINNTLLYSNPKEISLYQILHNFICLRFGYQWT